MSTTHCEQAKTGIFEGLSCKSLNGGCYATDEVGLGWGVIALLNLHAWLVLLHTWGWGGGGVMASLNVLAEKTGRAVSHAKHGRIQSSSNPCAWPLSCTFLEFEE